MSQLIIYSNRREIILVILYATTQDHLNDRVGDAGVLNRRPNMMGQLYSHCPYYLSSGVVAKLSEHHVLLECQSDMNEIVTTSPNIH